MSVVRNQSCIRRAVISYPEAPDMLHTPGELLTNSWRAVGLQRHANVLRTPHNFKNMWICLSYKVLFLELTLSNTIALWEPPTFIQSEVHLLGNGSIIRYPRKQIGKHILEVTQSTVGPPLLSTQQFGKHIFVTTNNLYRYAQATNDFHGYALAYTGIRSCAEQQQTGEYLHRNPSSRRRRRKGKTRIWDSKIWSRVPRDLDPRMTALARTSSNCKWQTRHFVRGNAPRQQTRNWRTVIKIWS
jgi:hypothetical protein